jgi:hypothetical protein
MGQTQTGLLEADTGVSKMIKACKSGIIIQKLFIFY